MSWKEGRIEDWQQEGRGEQKRLHTAVDQDLVLLWGFGLDTQSARQGRLLHITGLIAIGILSVDITTRVLNRRV